MRTIIGLSVAAALLVAGCGTTEDPVDTATSTGDPITVVDARGKEITLDGPAKRIATTEWNGASWCASRTRSAARSSRRPSCRPV